MNDTVFKYPVPIRDSFSLAMPLGSEILAFQTQREQPCIWVLIDMKAELVLFNFRLAGTRHLIEHSGDQLKYIGTCQLHQGLLTWHLFLEERKTDENL